MSSSVLSKYILKTDVDPISWGFYKAQESCDWSAEEFKFIQDAEDYKRASEPVKKVLKKIFGFFLIGDGIISEDLLPMIQEAINDKNWPLVFYLCMQLKVENTHAETYSKAALTIVPEEEHAQMIEMCEQVPCVKEKAEWMTRIDNHPSKALRAVACALGEGVGFVSLFSIIFFLRKMNIFKDFIESNEQISKDESLHRDQKAAQAKELLKPEEKEEAVRLIKEFVEIEKKFADFMLAEPIVSKQADADAGLTPEALHAYIETLGDQVAVLCGLKKVFGTSVTLKWMEDINLSQKSNFYERNVVGSYRKFNTEEQLSTRELENPDDVDF